MAEINKKELEHLAELARLDLKSGEEKSLQKDLEKILDYFKELQGLDTEGVEAMTGGTQLKNVLREDELEERRKRTRSTSLGQEEESRKAVEQFPEEKDGYLKIPPVF